MAETRVILIINNPFDTVVTCTNVSCEKFDDLSVGTVIPAKGSGTYTSPTSDRIFVTWESPTGGYWRMGMTVPKSSSNSACGYGNEGLQHYNDDVPCKFIYDLGQPNQASWDNPTGPGDGNPSYGDCS